MPPPTEADATDSPGPRPPSAGSANTGPAKNTRADFPHPAASAHAHPATHIPQPRHAHRTPSRRHLCVIPPSPRQAHHVRPRGHTSRRKQTPPSRHAIRGPAQQRARANRSGPTRRRLSSPAPLQPPPPRRPPEPGQTPREPLVARAHKPPHRAPGTPQPRAPAAEPSH